MDTTQIAKDSTREEAFALIHALRDRHSLVGTEFSVEDVTDAIASHLDGHDPSVIEAFSDHIASEIMAEYTWRKMGDLLAERGNEALGEAVSEAIPFTGILTADLDRSFAIVLGTDDSEGCRTSVIEIGGFETPDDAVAKALSLIGQTGARILSTEPAAEPLSNDLLDRPTRGYSLAIIENGATRAEFPATLPR